MRNFSFLLAGLITVSILFSAYFVWTNKKLDLTDKDRILILISLAACWGGLISATFVIPNYLQTNFAFVLSQKPHLLVQVVTFNNQIKDVKTGNVDLVSFTRIHYVNTSDNPFMDLTFDVKVSAGNRTIDLSDIFTKQMYMSPRDQRDRNFNTYEILKNRGIDVENEVKSGNQVILKIIYNSTFNQKVESVKIQEYKWNSGAKSWDII